jgi:hypothetical protein
MTLYNLWNRNTEEVLWALLHSPNLANRDVFLVLEIALSRIVSNNQRRSMASVSALEFMLPFSCLVCRVFKQH